MRTDKNKQLIYGSNTTKKQNKPNQARPRMATVPARVSNGRTSCRGVDRGRAGVYIDFRVFNIKYNT